VANGDIVRVADHQGKVLGTGHFAEGSIAVRLFSFGEDLINADFWKKKLAIFLNPVSLKII
jgi:23S rRNA (cytosine1962-C5)-methyltransferase